MSQWYRWNFLMTSDRESISAQLSEVVTANFDSPPGAKTFASITGPNGTGKSSLVRKWAKDRYLQWTADYATSGPDETPVWFPDAQTECDVVPVCWVNLPSAARVKDLNAVVLEFLELPGEGVARLQTGRMLRACERHRVRLLIIDDAHLLKSGQRIGREVLDHVKVLNTELGELGASIVLVGADLEGGELLTDPQIAARLKTHALGPMAAGTDAERLQWQMLLAEQELLLAPHLPQSEPGDLHDQLAGLLWARTQGYLGDLRDLLAEGAGSAIADGSGAITRAHIESVRLSARAEEGQARLEGRQR
ncbi:TniB family NTP-binding protein [Dietzia sp. 179-F 9C3 NHS]|uniref:TniB family NTP-binding protein n=1 Tax=Dietzia sp. 179-F 9C3 NHS TaxID=3374295 RepID=UPI003879A578